MKHPNPSSYDYIQTILKRNDRLEKMIDIVTYMNVNTPTINEFQDTMTKDNFHQNSILHLKRLTLLHKLLRSIASLQEINEKSEEKVNQIMDIIEKINSCCGHIQLSKNFNLLVPKKIEIKQPNENVVKIKTIDITDMFQKLTS